MNYTEAVDYIFGHTNYEIVPRVPHTQENYDLRRVFAVLERLDNPHLKAKSLHIAGTNGKGSTSAILASALTASGYKTGLYTSPHLHTMRERFAVDGCMIGERDVADITTRIKPEIEAVDQEARYGCLTVFEILTILGFTWFAGKKCEFQVMEVGMGGKFDATNVILPEVCLLTSINYDHMEVLGNTLTKIAAEKCGIIKSGCITITHPQFEEVEKVILEVCHEKDARLIRVGKDVTVASLRHDFNHQEIEVKGRLDDYKISIPLLGKYQGDNVAAAIASLEVLIEKGYPVPKESIIQGMADVKFPGRMHILSRRPLIVVDGGHNPGAVRGVVESLRQYFNPARAILVIGTSSDKDISGIVNELTSVFDVVIATRAHNPRSASPESLVQEFARHGINAGTAADIPQALAEARKLATDRDLICVMGSMFIAGEAIACLEDISNYK